MVNIRLTSIVTERNYMPEAPSTPNLVALPITSQELGKGSFLPPNQNSTIIIK